jgi:glutamine synthetase
MQSQREYVLRTVEERGVRFIQLWFTDVLGTPKSFAITPAELENALDEGMTFDGSAIDGFSRVQESDVLAKPDPKTFQILPLRGGRQPGEHSEVARVFCDIVNLDGSPFEGCPRHVLRRALEKARGRGFSFYAAPEIEYFYFADGSPTGEPVPLDGGSYFELTVADLASDLRQRTVLTLEDMGIPVEYAQHEDAPSQHEIDLRYTDAMTMADTVMLVRVVVKEMAARKGILATFMPKPLGGVQGSGMHTHMSLFDGDTNAFYDDSDEYHLSQVARQFIAGIIHHASEITGITNQWVNSYKRLIVSQPDQPLIEAPVYISWAQNNRSALIRVPPIKKGKRDSTRIEYRSPDPGANPYLAWAVILAAGLAGIRGRYELPKEASANIYHMSAQERLAEGIRPLPASLAEALDAMERSELVAEALGEHVFEWFLRNKRAEWAAYKAEVTPFELRRYLAAL